MSNGGNGDTSEILFAVDISPREPLGFSRVKNFILSIISSFALSQSQTRVGVVSSGSKTNPVIEFGKYSTYREYKDGVNALQSDGSTDLLGSLQSAYSMLSTTTRSGTPIALIIVTDSYYNEDQQIIDITKNIGELGKFLNFEPFSRKCEEVTLSVVA